MDDDTAAMQQAVLAAMEAGQQRYAGGDVAGAIEHYRRACARVRLAMAAAPAGDPQGPVNAQQLGSMLYALGEWQIETGDHVGAIDTLTEAESTYQLLGRLGGPSDGADAAQLVADVVIRRARAQVAAKRPLSAVADAQQAVLACLERADGDPGDPRRIDAARVVAFAGQVQLSAGGDPDLAVGAADWAMREYVTGLRVGDRFMLPAAQVSAFRAAGVVAYVVHTVAGRQELAHAARSFVAATGAGLPPNLDRTVAWVGSSVPTLAGALAEVGRAELKDILTAPATDVSLLVPAMRCSPQLAPVHARTLVDLQTTAASDSAAEALFGLEAHALFAAASQQRVLGMRYEFGQFGPYWATAVINYGQRHAEREIWPTALDAAAWLSGIVSQLFPHALIDATARHTALACASWSRDIYRAVGDTAAADRADHAVAQLEQLGPADAG